MRRALAPVLALALCVGSISAASGCGRSGVAPMAWAGSVCQALKPWRDEINGLNAQAATQMAAATTPRQTRDNLLRLLSGARDASEQARVKVAAAGVPDVKDGKAISDRFVGSLAGVRDAYGKAGDTIKGLALTPDKAFYDSVASAIGTLNKEYAQAGLDTSRVASAELRKDFNDAPGCAGG
jgi:hypothetical protein